MSQIIFSLTQSQFLPGVRGQGEAQHRHGGDQEARHDQVEEVVHRPPPDLEGVGDVQIRLGAAVVDNFVSFGGHSWEYRAESCCQQNIKYGSIRKYEVYVSRNIFYDILCAFYAV